jgi:RNA polymerase sigma-70 factor (ECF subfamily)
MGQEQLVEQLKSGDNNAFKELIDLYRLQMINLCYGFVRNQEDAEEIAQDVFIEVYRSVGNFRGDSKLSTWMFRIAVSKSLNKVRKNKFKTMISSIENIFEQHTEKSTNSNPHQLMQSKEDVKMLNKAIDKLPENQRIAFVLHHYDGYSYLQISEIMNASIPSVESLIHRAKVNLKNQLKNTRL